MTRARHYSEALFLVALLCQILHGLDRLAVVLCRYRVNVEEIEARLDAWARS